MAKSVKQLRSMLSSYCQHHPGVKKLGIVRRSVMSSSWSSMSYVVVLITNDETFLTLDVNDWKDDNDYEPYRNRQITNPNSTVGTLIHMVKGSLGTGIMAMPLAFKNGGLIFGSIGTIVICIIYVHCVHLLVSTTYKACKRGKVPLMGFAETVHDVFFNGPAKVQPLTKLVTGYVDVMIVIQSCLSFCLYLVFIAKSLRDVIYNQQQFDWDTRIYLLLLLIPMMLITQIRELKYLVLFSAIANLLIIAAICIILYVIFNEPLIFVNRKMWPQWSTLPSFVSTVLFAIQGIRYVLPIENKMQHPEHFLGSFGVLNIAISLLTVLYTITGFFGYVSYGEKTKGSVTLNLPENKAIAETTRLLAAIAILFTMGLSYYVPMEILWHHLQPKVLAKRANLVQIVLRFSVLVALLGIAIAIPEIEPFVGLVGSFGSATLAVLIPVTIDIIFRWPAGDFGRAKWQLVKNVVLLVFGLFVMVSGTYFSILDVVAIYK
ncbi:proton-coupled amino acid transporter-like protein CG1139 [Sabethes cyaneus]|uniref:proton-coupled amino acid transporter-like protein CG1139 n=1 Tax=Sabethes cyaneus TaxID=53552 RepID=UPI00237E5774|nr:proton-coupled amino acid transporter-like protein CG1139 [Sabethes cyaneus]